MRHRIGNARTGLGNSNPEILDNNGNLEKSEFWDRFQEDLSEILSLVKEYSGFDFYIGETEFNVGIEPAYAGERLQIIHFDFVDKNSCYKRTGFAFGLYGTGIRETYTFYGNYTYKSKFIKFIDKYYDDLKKRFACGKYTNQVYIDELLKEYEK